MTTQKAGKFSAEDVAKYFLSLQDENAGDAMSNLKLQKLLYYAQGFHLALEGEPLFFEPVWRWTHGPVVPKIYHHYKQYGGTGIPIPDDVDFENFDEETRDFLDEVYEVFGQYSAWKLRQMTHDEPPWRDTDDNTIIPEDSMARYFRTLIRDPDEDDTA